MSTTKLELTWIGKDQRPHLEPRILLEDPERGHCAAEKKDGDIFDNRLIFGDNLLALKALEEEFTGKVKCVYIDPPYNTGSAFEHYDDGVEHSLWLSLMRDRLNLLRRLLREDGFLCCHIDDSESHYLKILLDEVFERNNYLSSMYIQVRYANKTLKQDMSFHKQIEQVFVYRKSKEAFPNLPVKPVVFDKFNFNIQTSPSFDTISMGNREVHVYKKGNYTIKKGDGHIDGLKEIWATGSILDGNSSGRFFRDNLQGRVDEDGLGALYKVPNIGDDGKGFRYFTGPQRDGATKGKYFQGVPLKKRKDNMVQTSPIENFIDLAGSFGNCRHEGDVDFRSGKKPECLLKTLIELFSNPNDLILDSFGGSGTTGAVAHKMGRRWIMVELGEHCHTHIIPRLQKVINGEDGGGITDAVQWTGGGGFRYYSLGPSLIKLDQWGREIIAPAYRQNTAMLMQAVCKLHGYSFQPSDAHFWMHGQSTEADFIYVTTQMLTKEQIAVISEEVGSDRSLLICCGAHRLKDPQQFDNITVQKIPKSILEKCEWGQDDYSLKIHNLPVAESVPEVIPEAEKEEAKKAAQSRPRKKDVKKKKPTGKQDKGQTSFLDDGPVS